MDRFSGNDAERVGIANDITKDEKGMPAYEADHAEPPIHDYDDHGQSDVDGLGSRDQTPEEVEVADVASGEDPFRKAGDGACPAMKDRVFTPLGLTYLILAALFLGFGIFLLCVCAISASSASDALYVVLSASAEGADIAVDVMADATVALISGVISTLAFGVATILVGCITHFFAKKVQETEVGLFARLSKVAAISAIVMSCAVFVIAILVFIL